QFNTPSSVAPIDANHYYISDRNNRRIRMVRPNSIPYFFTGSSPLSLVVCENTIGDSLNALLAVMDSDKLQTLTWSVVTTASHGTLGGATTAATNGGVVTPHLLFYTPTPGYSGTDNFVIKVKDGFDSSITTVNVTVNPLPVVAAITGSNTVCVGANITLNDVTPGGVWSESTGNTSVVGGTVTGLVA